MNPITLGLIVQGIMAAVAAAPTVVEVVTKAKDVITALFTAKQITKAQQDAIHQQVDAICALAEAGALPGYWRVEADPQS